jgi:solute carrier family 38 (sodium-coupled neutral amino acid transporter), member 9
MEYQAIAGQALKLKVQRTLSNLNYLSEEAQDNVKSCRKTPLQLSTKLEVISPQVWTKSSAEMYLTPFQKKNNAKESFFSFRGKSPKRVVLKQTSSFEESKRSSSREGQFLRGSSLPVNDLHHKDVKDPLIKYNQNQFSFKELNLDRSIKEEEDQTSFYLKEEQRTETKQDYQKKLNLKTKILTEIPNDEATLLPQKFIPPGEEIPMIPSNSSIKTIFSVISNIVGSTVLILPTLNKDSGIFTCLIISTITGLISFHTCDLCVMHLKDEEVDLPEILYRILGKKGQVALGICSGVFNVLMTVSYYLLMVNLIFPMFIFMFEKAGYTDHPSKFDITFNTFSFQYSAIIGIIPCIFLMTARIELIIKLSQIGILPLIAFLIFLIYVFIDNVFIQDNLAGAEINYFSSNIPSAAGTFAISFYLHTAVAPIMKSNEKQENNKRDLFIGYFVSWLIYFFCGLVGYFGIIGRNVEKANNLMDYFGYSSIPAFIIQIIFIFKLCTAYPIFGYVAENQFLAIFYEYTEPPRWAKLSLKVFIILISLLLAIFCIDPTLVLSINGAIIGFFLIYILPVLFHIKCLRTSKSIDDQMNQDQSKINTNQDASENSKIFSWTEDQILDFLKSNQLITKCCKKHKEWIKLPFLPIYAFYTLVIGVGLAFLILQIYQISNGG